MKRMWLVVVWLAVLSGMSGRSLAVGTISAVQVLTPADTGDALAAVDDGFGFATGMDGDTLVVGAPFHDNGTPNSDAGCAYVFRQQNSPWTIEAKLLPSIATPGGFFGAMVAIHGDVIAIATTAGTKLIFVFRRTGTTWTQQAVLSTPNGAIENGLAINGTLLFAGAPTLSASAGGLYIFEDNGGTWNAVPGSPYSPPAGSPLAFGVSVSVADNYIGVGTWESAFVIPRQQSSPGLPEFSNSVLLDIAVGTNSPASVFVENDMASFGVANATQGVVYAYHRSGTSWVGVTGSPIVKTGSGQFGRGIGHALGRIVIGWPMLSGGGEAISYLTSLNNEELLLPESPETASSFGLSLAIQGQRLAVGAPGIASPGTEGSVDFYVLLGPTIPATST